MRRGAKLTDYDTSTKKVEYVHEEIYDLSKSNAKWTIFNKHALEIEELSPSSVEDSRMIEDRNIKSMKIGERVLQCLQCLQNSLTC